MFAQADPWQKYKHHPVVPESGVTGVVIIGICLVLVIWEKFKK